MFPSNPRSQGIGWAKDDDLLSLEPPDPIMHRDKTIITKQLYPPGFEI